MPVHIQEEAADVLIVKLSGKLTAADYELIVPALESRIEDAGPIRLLVDLHDFHGWECGALWEDTKFAVRHFGDIARLAIVGETRWEKGMATFCRPFTRASVKYFDRADEAAAHEWIHTGNPDEGPDVYGQK